MKAKLLWVTGILLAVLALSVMLTSCSSSGGGEGPTIHGKPSASNGHNGLPQLSIVPLTAWTEDPNTRDSVQIRLTKIASVCYLESNDYNGQTLLTPVSCPKG